MTHTPYGDKIKDQKAVIDEEQVRNAREIHKGYISDMALKVASENVGLKLFRDSTGRMRRNRHYLGMTSTLG